jgi:hypothetical protein
MPRGKRRGIEEFTINPEMLELAERLSWTAFDLNRNRPLRMALAVVFLEGVRRAMEVLDRPEARERCFGRPMPFVAPLEP